MAGLIICSTFLVVLGVTHFGVAVAYKIKTKSNRSIWWIMDNEI